MMDAQKRIRTFLRAENARAVVREFYAGVRGPVILETMQRQA